MPRHYCAGDRGSLCSRASSEEALPAAAEYSASLKTNPLFAGRNEHFLNALVNMFDVELFLEGSAILHQGELADKLYCLVSGEVEVLVDGKQVNRLSGKGVVFGLAAMFGSIGGNRRRNATIRALTVCECRAIQGKDFMSILVRYPEEHKHYEKMALDQIQGQSPVLKRHGSQWSKAAAVDRAEKMSKSDIHADRSFAVLTPLAMTWKPAHRSIRPRIVSPSLSPKCRATTLRPRLPAPIHRLEHCPGVALPGSRWWENWLHPGQEGSPRRPWTFPKESRFPHSAVVSPRFGSFHNAR